MFMLFVLLTCGGVSYILHCGFCFVFLRLVCPVLSISLDLPF